MILEAVDPAAGLLLPICSNSPQGIIGLVRGLNLWLSMLTGPAARLYWGSKRGCYDSLSKQEVKSVTFPCWAWLDCVFCCVCCVMHRRNALPFWLSGTTPALLCCEDTSCSTTLKMAPWRWCVPVLRFQTLSAVFELCPFICMFLLYSLIWRISVPSYGGPSLMSFILRICLLATE